MKKHITSVRYQDLYPSAALLRSLDIARPRAAQLLNLEYFEADPAGMPEAVFDQHHVLLNLRNTAHRAENWRDGLHRDFIYAPNEVVITPAGVRSGWYWHEKTSVIVITLDPNEFNRFVLSELGLILSARQLMDVPQAEDADLCQAGAMLLDALRDRRTGFEVMYESLARIFLVKLVQRYGEKRCDALPFSRGFTANHYKRVLDFVADHFDSAISTGDMARVAGLSSAHFSRLFKKSLGDSPYQFLMEYRVEQAKRMLENVSHSISEIAVACGFADQAHFSKVFKKLCGYTPKVYRTINSRNQQKLPPTRQASIAAIGNN